MLSASQLVHFIRLSFWRASHALGNGSFIVHCLSHRQSWHATASLSIRAIQMKFVPQLVSESIRDAPTSRPGLSSPLVLSQLVLASRPLHSCECIFRRAYRIIASVTNQPAHFKASGQHKVAINSVPSGSMQICKCTSLWRRLARHSCAAINNIATSRLTRSLVQ